MSTIRILCIDGGGIRGIIPASVLREILGGQRAQDVFHMIAGTSTGGILACGLAKPKPLAPQDLVDLYVKHGGEIFERSLAGRIPGHDLIRPKYDPDALEENLRRELGDTRLSEVTAVDLIVPSYAIELPVPNQNGDTRAAMFFRSWQARGEMLRGTAQAAEYDFFLRDVCRATSAAPTYFPPAEIRNRANQRFGMIDGGVFANNPTMCALAEAFRRYPADRNYLVVSLGTGHLQRELHLEKARSWGELAWAVPIISIFMDGNSDTVCVQAERMLEADAYHRFDIALGRNRTDPHAVNDDLDDASPHNIEMLLAKSEDLIRENRPKIDALAALLRTPRAQPTPAPLVA